MRVYNEILINAGNAAGNLTSAPLPLEYAFGYAIQCIFTGSVGGTLQLQVSCDAPANASFGYAGYVPTNWVNFGSPVTVTASSNEVFNSINAYYSFVRVVWTNSSGTGNLTVTGNVKGF
jgi:hypothetical protein